MKKVQGLFLVAMLFLAYTQLIEGKSLPGCPERCGSVTIEYPFGISPGCFYEEDESFNLTCDETDKLNFGGAEVINISHNGELRVLSTRSFACYNQLGDLTNHFYQWFRLGNLTFSDKNIFIAVGCNTYAYLETNGDGYSTGCMSICKSPTDTKGTCSSRGGCCQTSVPKESNYFSIKPYNFAKNNNRTSVYSFNPCSYAFLVEDGMFNFSSKEDLKDLRNVTKFPVVLDWSIGHQTCEEVGTKSICGANSKCKDSFRGTGYICVCEPGFDGNPYLSGENGCQDVDECTSNTHNCSGSSICENIAGHFLCNCPSGYDLNTTNNNCIPKDKPRYYEWTQIVLGTTIGFLCVLLGGSCIQQRMKHQKDIKLRQQYFDQNGGGMLMQRLSGAGSSNIDVKIFTEEGMKEATNGYDASRILGQGGQGTVYKGILPDNSIVAIKKAKLGDSSQVEQFINEVLVLSQINHRNVVKILGCCLETEIPLLVYEFITSGSLYDHLHGSLINSSFTWEHRLRIATEIAGTLAYLHSSASIPIIHRDIKTANILLDENLTAKVADFGASRLIPMDKEQLTTMVQGTLGYLDPEYYNTGLLNEKSDVYSFGVVLMELLSGQKALCFERPQTSKHLVSCFSSATKENRLHEIIDGQVMNEDNQKEIKEVARIALECTRVMGEERPKMKEVATMLEGLRVSKANHQRSDQYPESEESNHLLGVEFLSSQGETSSIGYDSIKNVTTLDIEAGR